LSRQEQWNGRTTQAGVVDADGERERISETGSGGGGVVEVEGRENED